MNNKKYSLLLIFLFLIPIWLMGLMNLIMDPYKVFGTPKISRINENTELYLKSERYSVPIRLQFKKENFIVFGSSTVNAYMGRHPFWEDTFPFMANMSGSNVYEIYRTVQQALYFQKPKKILIGLDFFAFNANSGPRPGFDETLFVLSPDGSPNESYTNKRYNTLFSYKTFIHGFSKIEFSKAVVSQKGRIEEQEKKILNRHKDFLDTNYHTLKNYIIRKPDGYRLRNKDADTLKIISELIQLISANDVEAHFIIQPSPRMFKYTLFSINEIETYNLWRQELYQVFKNSKKSKTYLHDMALYNKRQDSDFSDVLHFYQGLGGKILEDIQNNILNPDSSDDESTWSDISDSDKAKISEQVKEIRASLTKNKKF